MIKQSNIDNVAELSEDKANTSENNRCFCVPGLEGNSLTGMLNICFSLKNGIEISGTCPAQEVIRLEIPGFGVLDIQVTGFPGKERREIPMIWNGNRMTGAAERWRNYFFYLQENTDYSLTLSWDAAQGCFYRYLNGFKFSESEKNSWVGKTTFDKVFIRAENAIIKNVQFSPVYFDSQAISGFLNLDASLSIPPEIGQNIQNREFQIPSSELIYERKFSNQKEIRDWVMEGPGEMVFKDGWMEMFSKDPDGHHTLWCPEDFPDNYLLEWDFKPINGEGLCIVFIDAKGLNGEDIFSPSLTRRDGSFPPYWKGDFRNYHFSYYDGGVWIRSNKNPYKTMFGISHRPAYVKGTTYHMTLQKNKNNIIIAINNKVCVDIKDDPEKYNNPVWHGGKIGLRQMTPGHTAYRNFLVSEIV